MSSVKFIPHRAGIKHIPKDIVEKVEAREQLIRDFNRCLAVYICPRCGNTLVTTDTDETTTFECPSCKFEHFMYS